jgi:ornithine carbamoyltransferase
MKKSPRHFLTLLDYTAKELTDLLKLASDLKKQSKKGKKNKSLQGKILGMIFEKASTRTRVSFEAAMLQLGGNAIGITSGDSQIGRGETYEDTARVLSRYLSGIVLRTFSQVNLEKMASTSSVPVINGLTDLFHPVQILSDLLTILEVKKELKPLKIAYVGDGNNIANSWINAAIIFGFDLNVACPPGYGPSGGILNQISKYPHIQVMNDPVEAVKSADVINTDTWFSMGQEEDQKKRKLFHPFQVNQGLVSHGAPEVMVLHCLPAHREEEITNEVMDGPHSYVWEEAENRLHVQKAILKTLL